MTYSKRTLGIIVLSVMVTLGGIIGWLWLHGNRVITPFRPADRAAIITILNEDWQILVAEGSDFSAEYMLDHMAADYHYPDNSLSIVVCREQGKVVGFITYHLLDGFHGRIQFLAIARGYRGRGYGGRLMQHAMEDMRSQGVCFIELVTRISNEPARALYRKLGFVERWYEGDFVGFSVSLCRDMVPGFVS